MSRPAQVAVLLALALAGVLAACGAASLEVRDEGPARGGTVSLPESIVTQTIPETVQETVQQTVTVASPADSSTSGTDTVSTAPGVAEEPRASADVYLVRYGQPEAVAIPIDPPTTEPEEAALAALLAGPTPAELSLRYTSAVPPETVLLDFAIQEGTAYVNLSDAFVNPPRMAVYQLIYTLTPPQGEVRQVQISVDGAPLDLGAGATGPLTRSFADALVGGAETSTEQLTGPPCDATTVPEEEGAGFVLSFPQDGERFPRGGPLRIAGLLREPGSVVVVRLIQYRQEVRHAISPPCQGEFVWTMPLPADLVGPVTIEAYVPSRGGHEAVPAPARGRDRVT